jgi:hypothetical protein
MRFQKSHRIIPLFKSVKASKIEAPRPLSICTTK